MIEDSLLGISYLILNEENKWAILRERIGLLEADLFRAELQLSEALSDTERRAVMFDIERLVQRLAPHHDLLGKVDPWRVAPSIPDSTRPVGDHAEGRPPNPGR